MKKHKGINPVNFMIEIIIALVLYEVIIVVVMLLSNDNDKTLEDSKQPVNSYSISSTSKN